MIVAVLLVACCLFVSAFSFGTAFGRHIAARDIERWREVELELDRDKAKLDRPRLRLVSGGKR